MYDTVESVCHCLTNFHITRHPLRNENNVFFKQPCRRVYAQSMKREKKRKADANNYFRQRQRRLENIENSENGGGETMILKEVPDDSNFIEQEEEIEAETVTEERLWSFFWIF